MIPKSTTPFDAGITVACIEPDSWHVYEKLTGCAWPAAMSDVVRLLYHAVAYLARFKRPYHPPHFLEIGARTHQGIQELRLRGLGTRQFLLHVHTLLMTY